MICPKCSQKIPDNDNRCPYCNAKVDINYSVIYPAYANKKYYTFLLPTELWCFIAPALLLAFMALVFVKIKLAFIFMGCMDLVLWIIVFYFGIKNNFHYMIWSGDDTLILQNGKRTQQFNLQSVLLVSPEKRYVYQKISSFSKMRGMYYAVVSKDNTVMFLIRKTEDAKNFFMHFAIPVKSYIEESDGVSW